MVQPALVPHESSLQPALEGAEHSPPETAGQEKEDNWVKAAVEG